MPLYFVVFLVMLAASLLLYSGGVVTAIFRRRSSPTFVPEAASSLLQASGVALLWANVGVGWLLFCNVYPIHIDMAALGNEALQAFSRGYTRRLPIVVLPYGLTCLVWALALWSKPGRYSRRDLWGIATLCTISVLVTPFAAGAQGEMQEHGFTYDAYNELQTAHLVRTLALTIAALWATIEGWRAPLREEQSAQG